MVLLLFDAPCAEQAKSIQVRLLFLGARGGLFERRGGILELVGPRDAAETASACQRGNQGQCAEGIFGRRHGQLSQRPETT